MRDSRAVLAGAGVALAIGTRLAGIAWSDLAWTIVPASVLASALIALPGGDDRRSAAPGRTRPWRALVWALVAIACIAAIGASRSRGPAIAFGVGAATWVVLAAVPRGACVGRIVAVAVAVASGVTVIPFVVGSALPAAIRAYRALPAGMIGGGGAMAELQAQANALGRDTLGTREIAWLASLDAYRSGSRVLNPSWIGNSMASSGHQVADLDAIAALPDHRAATSLLRRAIGYGPESQIALIGSDAVGQPFDRAHAAPLDILLAHGAIGLAAATLLAVTTVVVALRHARRDGAPAGDRAVVPLLVVSGVAGLTGVDGTAQVLATWALVASALARVTLPSVHGAPTGPVAGGAARSSLIGIAAGLAITGAGIGVAATVGDGATSPATWGIAVAASVASAFAVALPPGHLPEGGWWRWRAGAPFAAVAVVATLMAPAWSALAAGAEARASTVAGTSVEDRQARLSRAITLDPGVVTYRQLRGT